MRRRASCPPAPRSRSTATICPLTPPRPTRPARLTGNAIPPCGARRSTSARTPRTPAGAPPTGRTPPGAGAATALEESRIEARQVTRRPADRAWLRASTAQIVIRDFTAAATPPASPAEAGSAAALILAREDAGILEPAENRAGRPGGRRRDRPAQAGPAPPGLAARRTPRPMTTRRPWCGWAAAGAASWASPPTSPPPRSTPAQAGGRAVPGRPGGSRGRCRCGRCLGR